MSASDPQGEVPLLFGELTSAFEQHATTLSGFAFSDGWVQRVETQFGDGPFMLAGISANALRTLGVTPVLGRDFVDDDQWRADSPAVMLTSDAWRTRFGGSASVLSVTFGTPATYRVVGVLPKTFLLPSARFVTRFDGVYVRTNRRYTATGMATVAPFARLNTGASLAAAETELNALARQLPWGTPALREQLNRNRIRVLPLQDGLTLFWGPSLRLAVVAMWLVIAVAGVNLSLLLLTRERLRHQELRIRATLGAPPWRLLRFAMVDSVFLCTAAAFLAVSGAFVASGGIRATAPPLLRGFVAEPLDPRLIFVTFSVALFCAVGAGLAPGLLAARSRVLTPAAIGPVTHRTRSFLSFFFVALQAAITSVVLFTTSAALPRIVETLTQRPGFIADNMYLLAVSHGFVGFDDTESVERPSRVARIMAKVRALPHVKRASSALEVPFGRSLGDGEPLQPDGDVRGHKLAVDVEFFETLGVRMVAGRGFSAEDVTERHLVAVVNRRAAALFWPTLSGADVLGQLVRTADGSRVVVGVSDDLIAYPGEPARPMLFLPITSREAVATSSQLAVCVRMEDGVPPQLETARTLLDTEFGGRAALAIQYVPNMLGPAYDRPRFLAVVICAMACIAVMLSMIGLYSLTSLDLIMRHLEVVIRLALGGSRLSVARGILVFPLAAIVAGTLAGLAATRWVESTALFGSLPRSGAAVTHYSATVFLVFVTASVALFVPLYRCTTLNLAFQLRNGR